MADEHIQGCDSSQLGRGFGSQLSYVRAWHIAAFFFDVFSLFAALILYRPTIGVPRSSLEHSLWPLYLLILAHFFTLEAILSINLLAIAVTKAYPQYTTHYGPGALMDVLALIFLVIAAIPILWAPWFNVAFGDPPPAPEEPAAPAADEGKEGK